MKDQSEKGVAQAHLRTRLNTKTSVQQAEMSVAASDEVAGIRMAVFVESISLTEGQARQWSEYLAAVREIPEGEGEADAAREILQRAALPITAVVALRNHWRFTSPAEAFSAFWTESRNAVARFDPLRGRLRFDAFMESTLSMRAEAIAEEQQGERKLQERLDSLQAWIDDLGLSLSVTAEGLYQAIRNACEDEDFAKGYFRTLIRVRNTLEVLQTRGYRVLSLDFQDDDEQGVLRDTLTTDEEDADHQRQLAALSPVLQELEDEGLLDEVLALPEGYLHTLLEGAAKGQEWLNTAASTLGVSSDLAKRVSSKLIAFYKSA